MHGYSARPTRSRNTAFRGFGGPQGAIAIEAIIDEIARTPRQGSARRSASSTSTAPTERNVTPYGQTVDDNIIHGLVDRLLKTQRLRERRREQIARLQRTEPGAQARHRADAGEVRHLVQRRRTSTRPARWSTCTSTARCWSTTAAPRWARARTPRCAQVVAHELGVPLAQRALQRHRHAEGGQHLGHGGIDRRDLNGKAAQDAARQIRERLAAFAAERIAAASRDVRFADDVCIGDRPACAFCELVRGLPRARAAVVRRLLRHARAALGPRDDAPAGRSSTSRTAPRSAEVVVDTLHRRMQPAARRPAARRRQLAQSGDRHRPGRRRVHPGHGLADDRGAVVEPGRPADDARAEHLQDPTANDCPAAFHVEAVTKPQRRRQHPSQQGGRRAAAAAAVLGVLRDPRRGVGGRRPPGRPAAAGAGDDRSHPARDQRGASPRPA